jgi:hypothetical protein
MNRTKLSRVPNRAPIHVEVVVESRVSCWCQKRAEPQHYQLYKVTCSATTHFVLTVSSAQLVLEGLFQSRAARLAPSKRHNYGEGDVHNAVWFVDLCVCVCVCVCVCACVSGCVFTV